MQSLGRRVEAAIKKIKEEGGYIALIGGMPRNLPPWVSESRLFRFIKDGETISDTCRLLLVGRHIQHSHEKRNRALAQGKDFRGFVKTGQLSSVLKVFKDELLPDRRSVVVEARVTASAPGEGVAEPTAAEAPKVVALKPPVGGDGVALAKLYEEQIIQRYREGQSGALIGLWLVTKAREEGFEPSADYMRHLTLAVIRNYKQRRSDGAELLAESNERATAETAKIQKKVEQPSTTAQRVAAELVSANESVVLSASVAANLEALVNGLGGVVNLEKENTRLRAENAALKEKLEKLKAALS